MDDEHCRTKRSGKLRFAEDGDLRRARVSAQKNSVLLTRHSPTNHLPLPFLIATRWIRIASNPQKTNNADPV
jgi:hypothetical protein